MPTYRIDLAYDGSGFHGYARQAEVRTVQGVLEDAIARVIGPVETSVAGRTDAGVHARRQVVSFRSDAAVDLRRLHRSLVTMLAPEIVVWEVVPAPDDFDARFSARSRTYRYRVLDRLVPDPFLRHTSWHVPYRLDHHAMEEASAIFVGEHDFASFCRGAEGRTTMRRVLEADWAKGGDLSVFRIRSSSFCHQMVRSLVALCVEIGRGRMEASAVPGIIRARDRDAARGAAPPHGLMLWEVEY